MVIKDTSNKMESSHSVKTAVILFALPLIHYSFKSPGAIGIKSVAHSWA